MYWAWAGRQYGVLPSRLNIKVWPVFFYQNSGLSDRAGLYSQCSNTSKTVAMPPKIGGGISSNDYAPVSSGAILPRNDYAPETPGPYFMK